MSVTNNSQPGFNQPLDQVLASYFVKFRNEKCYVGLMFQQGRRDMVQINVPAEDLPTLLQAKPSTDNNPDSGKNRPEVKGHAKEIKDYIRNCVEKDKPWILGTLTANVAPEKIELIELGCGICMVVIPRGVKLDITDGQHRKRAIHELIESTEGELIGNNNFPITLVLEGNDKQCQIDFRDMAKTKPLEKSLLKSFGEVEGRVGITKNLIKAVSIFQEKTEKIKDKPSSKNKLIYSTTYISNLVSLALKNNLNDELKDYDIEKSSEALINCLNQFFSQCSQTSYISETAVENLTVEEVEDFKNNCILGISVGLQVLGKLLYYTYDKENNYFLEDKVSEISQLDWSRGGILWQGNIIRKDENTKNTAKQYKVSYNASSINTAIYNAKSQLGWQ